MAGEVAVEAEGGGNGLSDRVAAFGQALDKSVMSFGNVAGRLGEFGGALEKAGGIVGTVAKQFVERLSAKIGEYFTTQLNKVFDKIIDPVVKIVAAIFDPLFDIVGAALLPLQKSLEVLGSALGLVMSPLSNLAKIFEALFKPLDAFMQIIEQEGKIFASVLKLMISPLQLLLIPFKALEVPMRMFGRLVDEAAKMVERFVNKLLAPLQALEALQGKAHDSVNGVFDTLDKLASDPIGGFNAAISAIGGFVAAIDPSVMEMFDAAMRDLAAVIGEALRPAMYVAVDVVRTFAGTLRPLLQSIAPEISKLARAFGNELNALIPVFINYLRDLMPVLRIYISDLARQLKDNAALLRTWQTLRQAIEAAVKPLTDFVSSLLPGKRNGLSFVQSLARAVIAVTAFVAKMLGATDAFNKMVDSFSEKGGGADFNDATGLAAANNPTFKSIEQLGRDIQQAAFVSMAGNDPNGGMSGEDLFRKEVLDSLQYIKGTSLQTVIAEGVLTAFKQMPNGIDKVRSMQPGRYSTLLGVALDAVEMGRDLLPG